ncbi:unnamed protein product [Closterium sp. NIES-65]|nr:unnamed protein product [Closterium sp. NIES-65]
MTCTSYLQLRAKDDISTRQRAKGARVVAVTAGEAAVGGWWRPVVVVARLEGRVVAVGVVAAAAGEVARAEAVVGVEVDAAAAAGVGVVEERGSGGGGRGGAGGGQGQQHTPSPQEVREWYSQHGGGVGLSCTYVIRTGDLHCGEGAEYLCVPPDPGIRASASAAPGTCVSATPGAGEAAALGARVSAPLGTESTASTAHLHTGLRSAVAPCSCRSLAHETVLWHHRLGHPSVQRLRAMHSRYLVSGLPKVLPALPPSPAPTCLPCVEGRQCAAPHSSSFPPTTAPLQTLHMDVWGPARIRGQGQERYFLIVVDDYSRYTSVFPLRTKEVVSSPPDLLAAYCAEHGIEQSFALPASPQQNGVAERRIGPGHGGRPYLLDPCGCPPLSVAVCGRYAAHHLNLWPRVSLPETSPTLLRTGEVGDASRFPGAAVADPLPPQGAAPSGVSQVDPVEPVEVVVDSRPAGGVEPGGAEPGGVEPGSAEPGGVEPGGVELGGAELGGAEPGGAELGGAELRGAEPQSPESGGSGSGGTGPGSPTPGGALSSKQLREWYLQYCSLRRGAARAKRAAGIGASASSPIRELTSRERIREWYERRCTLRSGVPRVADPAAVGAAAGAEDPGVGAAAGAADPGVGAAAGPEDPGVGAAADTADPGVGAAAGAEDPSVGAGAGAEDPGVGAAAGATDPGAGAAAGAADPGVGAAVGAADPGVGAAAGAADPGAGVPAGSGVAAQSRPYFVPLLQQVLGTHRMALRPSTAPQRVPLPSPPASSLPALADPESDSLRAASPTVTRLLSTVVTNPSFESATASALVAELVDFAATCRLDYAASLVAESESVC